MNRKGLVVLSAIAVLAATASSKAVGDVRRQVTERRPYITEIGQPYEIKLTAVEHEAKRMNELREYLGTWGPPDYAEIQETEPAWPFEAYEVRLFYLQRNLEAAFSHVVFSPAMPNLGILRFQGDIDPLKRHQIGVILQARAGAPLQPPPPAAVVAPQVAAVEPALASPLAPRAVEQSAAPGTTEAIVARLEAAAERAAQAADRAAEDSEAAVRAADRTVTIVEKMAQSLPAPTRRSRTR